MPQHHATKMYGQVEEKLNVFLNPAHDETLFKTSGTGCVTHRCKLDWGGGGVQNGAHEVAKRSVPALKRHRTPVVQPVACRQRLSYRGSRHPKSAARLYTSYELSRNLRRRYKFHGAESSFRSYRSLMSLWNLTVHYREF